MLGDCANRSDVWGREVVGVTYVPAFIDVVLGDCANRSDVWGREVIVRVSVCETPHNTISNDNDMMLRVNDMYTDVRACTCIDLHDKDVA